MSDGGFDVVNVVTVKRSKVWMLHKLKFTGITTMYLRKMVLNTSHMKDPTAMFPHIVLGVYEVLMVIQMQV